MKKRILTGDNTTGKLHLGHYVGSIQNRIKHQKDYETFIVKIIQIYYNDNYEIYQSIKEENITELVCI